MKKLLFLPVIFAFIVSVVPAQNKLFTMEDAVLNGRTFLAPKRLNQLMWVKGSNNYSFVEKGEVLMRGSAENNKTETIISLETLNQELKKNNIESYPMFPLMSWENENTFGFDNNNQRISFDVKTKKIAVAEKNLGQGAMGHDEEPNTKTIAYCIENNLYIYKNGKKIQITNDSEKNIVNGQSVHRDEFGIHKGTFWSPKGDYLAFYKMNQTMVSDYPITDYNTRPASVKTIKYPFAGDPSHQVSLGVFNVSSGTTTFIKTGEPLEQYLTNIAWSPDEKHIYIAVLNRDQNHLKLNCYNASTGDFEKTLIEEKNDKYVQPLHPLTFLKNDENKFIWQSERDGFNHFYLYDIKGNLIKQLTKGNWEITELAGFDASGEKVFYNATNPNGLNRDLFSLNIKTNEIKRLTKGDGTHTVFLNDNASCFLDIFTNTETPRIISIYKTNGEKIKEILNADNPVKDYKLGAMSLFQIKSDLGDELNCRMFKPVDFDSTKKYPVIVYLYNGPGIQLITNSWLGGADLWYQYMAQKGYIVFTLDGHGSAHRGKAFEQVTFRNLGNAEMQDQLKGVDYLKSLTYVDSSRIGVHGWSYGGFMTTSLMTRQPGVFKVGVSGGPVIDWSYYEIMYTERYMDTPETNKSGYESSNLLNYISQLKGKLMLIHGTVDDVVVWQHSVQYVKKAVDKGVQIDYFMYPGHPHNVRGKDRVHLMNKVSSYFIENL